MNQFSTDDIDHQQKLWDIFQRPENKEFRVELEQCRKDLVEFMSQLDVSIKDHEIKHIKSKGQLELIDEWLKMPDLTKSFLEQVKDVFRIPF